MLALHAIISLVFNRLSGKEKTLRQRYSLTGTSRRGWVTRHNAFLRFTFLIFNPKGLLFCVNLYNKLLVYEIDFPRTLLEHVIKLRNALFLLEAWFTFEIQPALCAPTKVSVTRHRFQRPPRHFLFCVVRRKEEGKGWILGFWTTLVLKMRTISNAWTLF